VAERVWTSGGSGAAFLFGFPTPYTFPPGSSLAEIAMHSSKNFAGATYWTFAETVTMPYGLDVSTGNGLFIRFNPHLEVLSPATWVLDNTGDKSSRQNQ
jgi:hypothetical protein